MALAPNARVVTGLSDPARGTVTVTLLYRDKFGKLRKISAPTLTLNLPASTGGQTVSEPKLRIDSSAPSVRARSLRGRRVALFLARDSQSDVSIISSAAFATERCRGAGVVDAAYATLSTFRRSMPLLVLRRKLSPVATITSEKPTVQKVVEGARRIGPTRQRHEIGSTSWEAT